MDRKSKTRFTIADLIRKDGRCPGGYDVELARRARMTRYLAKIRKTYEKQYPMLEAVPAQMTATRLLQDLGEVRQKIRERMSVPAFMLQPTIRGPGRTAAEARAWAAELNAHLQHEIEQGRLFIPGFNMPRPRYEFLPAPGTVFMRYRRYRATWPLAPER